MLPCSALLLFPVCSVPPCFSALCSVLIYSVLIYSVLIRSVLLQPTEACSSGFSADPTVLSDTCNDPGVCSSNTDCHHSQQCCFEVDPNTKRFKRTPLFIMRRIHNMQNFGEIPFVNQATKRHLNFWISPKMCI